jgi:glycosyltransferase involved in cell wall biosynthesis
LIVAGEHIDPHAPDFVAARERWAGHLLHWGYASAAADYSRLLHRADIVVSTAAQEFFGISMIEALYCGCIPVLPRRLTYPDLLPAAHHADCLYTSPAELVERLQHVIRHYADLRRRDWRSIAAPYDWTALAPRYDAALAAVQASTGS